MKRNGFPVDKVFSAVFGVFMLITVLGCPNLFMKKVLGSNNETPLPPVTVTFDKNGGDTEADPIITALQKGAAVETLPKPPTRMGYAFNGWNTKKDGSGAGFTATTPVNESMTVYAQWMYDPAAFALGGTGPGGGIIFYIDSSPAGFTVEGYGNPGDTGYFASYTARYLEAAPEDMPSTLMWAPFGTPAETALVPGLSENFSDTTDRAIGRGKKNTAFILAYVTGTAADAPAAHACDTYTSPTGKDDWFLPSGEELEAIYDQWNVEGKPPYYGFPPNNYWSSSQASAGFAWFVNFSSGDLTDGGSKFGQMNVRAIRAF